MKPRYTENKNPITPKEMKKSSYKIPLNRKKNPIITPK